MRFRTVVLDCDSTLCAIEGVDQLATNHRQEVTALTDAAMRGEVPFEEVYGRRLALVQPSRAAVDALAVRYIDSLVPDAREVVAALKAEGIAVRIVSGGLRTALLPMVKALGLDVSSLAAVDVYWKPDGSYAGFDASSPLTRDGGKLGFVKRWRDELGAPLMMVGDGHTDLDAKPAADMFVAYAAIVERPKVVAEADVVLRAPSLAPILTLALGNQRPADDRAAVLYDAGFALLLQGSPTPVS
jgi:phosphoserine phosphatase